jgi:hypothetical protein
MDNQEKLQSISPVVDAEVRPVTYLFSDALREVLNGNKITRIAWGNKDIYGIMNGGILCLYGGENGDSTLHHWTITEGDMTADDWVIL